MPERLGHEPQKELGTAIRNLRKRAGLSQAGLGRLSELDATQINRIENGHVDPTYGNVRRIAQGLGTTLRKLSEEAARVEGREGRPPRVTSRTPAWLERMRARRAEREAD